MTTLAHAKANSRPPWSGPETVPPHAYASDMFMDDARRLLVVRAPSFTPAVMDDVVDRAVHGPGLRGNCDLDKAKVSFGAPHASDVAARVNRLEMGMLVHRKAG